MAFGTKKLFVALSFVLSFLCGYGADEIREGYGRLFPVQSLPTTEAGVVVPSPEKPPGERMAPSETSAPPPENTLRSRPVSPSPPLPLPNLGRERRSEYDSLFPAQQESPAPPLPENPYEQLNALVPASPPPSEGPPVGFDAPQVVSEDDAGGEDEAAEEEEVIGDDTEEEDESVEEEDDGLVDESDDGTADEEGGEPTE